MINIKVEFKHKSAKHCILASAVVENADVHSYNITFTIKDTKLYVPVVTLSAKDNQKLSKLLGKRFERWVSWNECKTKCETKIRQNECRHFIGVNMLIVLTCLNRDNDAKHFKAKIYWNKK